MFKILEDITVMLFDHENSDIVPIWVAEKEYLREKECYCDKCRDDYYKWLDRTADNKHLNGTYLSVEELEKMSAVEGQRNFINDKR